MAGKQMTVPPDTTVDADPDRYPSLDGLPSVSKGGWLMVTWPERFGPQREADVLAIFATIAKSDGGWGSVLGVRILFEARQLCSDTDRALDIIMALDSLERRGYIEVTRAARGGGMHFRARPIFARVLEAPEVKIVSHP